MIAKLERLIGEIGDLNSKLVLLVGASRSGKTKLLREQARSGLREQKFEEAYLELAKDLRARAYVEMRDPPL